MACEVISYRWKEGYDIGAQVDCFYYKLIKIIWQSSQKHV